MLFIKIIKPINTKIYMFLNEWNTLKDCLRHSSRNDAGFANRFTIALEGEDGEERGN